MRFKSCCRPVVAEERRPGRRALRTRPGPAVPPRGQERRAPVLVNGALPSFRSPAAGCRRGRKKKKKKKELVTSTIAACSFWGRPFRSQKDVAVRRSRTLAESDLAPAIISAPDG